MKDCILSRYVRKVKGIFFGEIHNGQMNLSQIGLFVDNELKNPQIHNKHIKIPMYVVMPNHIHAIIEVESLDSDYYENTTALSAEIRTPNPGTAL